MTEAERINEARNLVWKLGAEAPLAQLILLLELIEAVKALNLRNDIRTLAQRAI